MDKRLRSVGLAYGVAALFLLYSAHPTAQTGVMLSGRLTNSLSGDPIPNATVRIDELNREAKSGTDGSFTFENVPPGTYDR